ncbi:ABC transporter permease subunit [Bacillus sp. REN16]|uniref:ABC transporter permease subunit n=1 Tax=Bacillus sp. REN16 TaxID=2887296 RepID=UPI001E3F9F03|nr:ABC transporter permease subunit [Bacillus sp. REN16]MCC3358550.1 ABC transporter permease subunit [Bacillus sp. REN16]
MKNPSLIIGTLIFSLIVLMAIFGPYLPFIDEELTEHLYLKLEDGTMVTPPFPPSEEFLLGSDRQGVDLLSRLVIGTKETLLIIFSVVVIRLLIGAFLGIGAFYSRFLKVILKVWHQVFSYIPSIFLLVMIVGIPFFLYSPHRPYWFILVLALIEVGRVGDVLNKYVSEIAAKPYYEAGIVVGGTPYSLARRYLYPNMRSQVITLLANELGRTLFLIAQLGIVKIFISVAFENDASGSNYIVNSSDSWPVVLSTILNDMWGVKIIPFSAIFLISITVLSFYLIGNGLVKKINKK